MINSSAENRELIRHVTTLSIRPTVFAIEDFGAKSVAL
jgi:hypothetical protein